MTKGNKFRNLLASFVVLFSSIMAVGSTVSGTLYDTTPAHLAIPYGTLVFSLSNCSGIPISLVDGSNPPTSVSLTASSAGVVTGTVLGNDQISCDLQTTSWYTVSIYTAGGNVISSQHYQLVNATPFNINTASFYTTLTPTNPNFLYNPMTTAGDTVVAGLNGAPTRLALGSNGTQICSNGTTAYWGNCGGGSSTGITSITMPSDFIVDLSSFSANMTWNVNPSSSSTPNAIAKRDSSSNIGFHAVTLDIDPTSAMQAATKEYVDNHSPILTTQTNGTNNSSQTTLNMQNSSGAGEIDFTNPNGGNVQAALHNTSMNVNGIDLSLGGTYTLDVNECSGSQASANACHNNNQLNAPYTTTAGIGFSPALGPTDMTATIPGGNPGYPTGPGCAVTKSNAFICWATFSGTSMTGIEHIANTPVTSDTAALGVLQSTAISSTAFPSTAYLNSGQYCVGGCSPGLLLALSVQGNAQVAGDLSANGDVFSFASGGGNQYNAEMNTTSGYAQERGYGQTGAGIDAANWHRYTDGTNTYDNLDADNSANAQTGGTDTFIHSSTNGGYPQTLWADAAGGTNVTGYALSDSNYDTVANGALYTDNAGNAVFMGLSTSTGADCANGTGFLAYDAAGDCVTLTADSGFELADLAGNTMSFEKYYIQQSDASGPLTFQLLDAGANGYLTLYNNTSGQRVQFSGAYSTPGGVTSCTLSGAADCVTVDTDAGTFYLPLFSTP